MISLTACDHITLSSGQPLACDQCQLASSSDLFVSCDGHKINEIGCSSNDRLSEYAHILMSEAIAAISPRPGGKTKEIALLSSSGDIIMASMGQGALSKMQAADDPWKSMSWDASGMFLALASKCLLSICHVINDEASGRLGLEIAQSLPLKVKSVLLNPVRLCWGTDRLFVCTDEESFIWTAEHGGMARGKTVIMTQGSLPRCIVPGPGDLFLMTLDAPLTLFCPSDIKEYVQPILDVPSLEASNDLDPLNALDLRGQFKESTDGPVGLFDIWKHKSNVSTVFALDKQEVQTNPSGRSRLVLSDGFLVRVEMDLQSPRPDMATSFLLSNGNRSLIVVGSSSTSRMIMEMFEACSIPKGEPQCSLQSLSILSLQASPNDIRLCGLSIVSMGGQLKLGALYGPRAIDENKPNCNFFSNLTRTGLGITRISELRLSIYPLPLTQQEETNAATATEGDKKDSGNSDSGEANMISIMMSKMEGRLTGIMEERLGRIEDKLDALIEGLQKQSLY